MKKSNLDQWVREKEGLSSLTRKDIEEVQLQKLNRLLAREKKRGGFYENFPEKLESLEQLSALPFRLRGRRASPNGFFIRRKIMSAPFRFSRQACLNW